mgnify:FL=1
MSSPIWRGYSLYVVSPRMRARLCQHCWLKPLNQDQATVARALHYADAWQDVVLSHREYLALADSHQRCAS